MVTAPMQPPRGRAALWVGLTVLVAGGAFVAALDLAPSASRALGPQDIARLLASPTDA